MDLSYFSHPRQDYHHKNKFDLTLDRIQACLQELKSIHLHLPPTIHVAGTNGKCSTIAFMRSILEQAGLSVHIFTSPHLLKVNERIILAGQEISDLQLSALIHRLAPSLEKHKLSWFEAITVIAFQAFHEVPADVLLLEVGLGGELDATNVVTPIASVITPISYDHTDYLGQSLHQIASAKAGIIKQNVPVFSTTQEPEVQKILTDTAKNNNCTLSIQAQEWYVRNNQDDWSLCLKDEEIDLPYPQRLLGKHQLQNAALALATLKTISHFQITTQAIQHGIEKACWPGRLMQIKNSKLIERFPEGSEIWFDGAHNPAAASVLRDYFSENKTKPLVVICGQLKSKNAPTFIEMLKPVTDQFIFVPISNHDFCYSPKELQQYEPVGQVANSVYEAFDVIPTKLKNSPATILICGSFYLGQELM